MEIVGAKAFVPALKDLMLLTTLDLCMSFLNEANQALIIWKVKALLSY